jgi:hypothetical protein
MRHNREEGSDPAAITVADVMVANVWWCTPVTPSTMPWR